MAARLTIEQGIGDLFTVNAHHRGKRKLKGVSWEMVYALLSSVESTKGLRFTVTVSKEEAAVFERHSRDVHKKEPDTELCSWIKALSS